MVNVEKITAIEELRCPQCHAEAELVEFRGQKKVYLFCKKAPDHHFYQILCENCSGEEFEPPVKVHKTIDLKCAKCQKVMRILEQGAKQLRELGTENLEHWGTFERMLARKSEAELNTPEIFSQFVAAFLESSNKWLKEHGYTYSLPVEKKHWSRHNLSRIYRLKYFKFFKKSAIEYLLRIGLQRHGIFLDTLRATEEGVKELINSYVEQHLTDVYGAEKTAELSEHSKKALIERDVEDILGAFITFADTLVKLAERKSLAQYEEMRMKIEQRQPPEVPPPKEVALAELAEGVDYGVVIIVRKKHSIRKEVRTNAGQRLMDFIMDPKRFLGEFNERSMIEACTEALYERDRDIARAAAYLYLQINERGLTEVLKRIKRVEDLYGR